jgi:hypothetical protein
MPLFSPAPALHAFVRQAGISLVLAGCANDHTSEPQMHDGVTDASSMGNCNQGRSLSLPGTNGYYVDGGPTVRFGSDASLPCAMEAPHQ